MPIDPKEYFENNIIDSKPSPENYRQLMQLLWESYSQSIFLYACAKLEDQEEARDVCQDAFLQAMEWLVKNPGQVPTKVNFPAWLRRIARNIIIDRFRRPALIRQLPYTQDGAADDEQLYADWPEISTCGPLDNIVKEEKIDALQECIDALPNRKKQVVILRDVEGLSYSTIAKKVAMPQSTVGVTLHRVRKDLRECVELKLLR